MKSFPAFIKQQANRVAAEQQNTPGIEGYYYEGKDGSQVALWECLSEQSSKKHVHAFDEYMICLSGEYVAYLDGGEHILSAGDELYIPKGTEQWGRCKAGTRTVHVFGGKRIK